MHEACRAYVKRVLADIGPRRIVVEIGSRVVNGHVRGLLGNASYLGIDLKPGPGVAIVADGATYQPAIKPDCVLCLEVLEHAPNAEQIVANAYRMLAHGGVFITTMACDPREPHSAEDGGPLAEGEFYHNVEMYELLGWLSDAGFGRFDHWSHDLVHGDLGVVAWKEM